MPSMRGVLGLVYVFVGMCWDASVLLPTHFSVAPLYMTIRFFLPESRR
jgi:hypothetical protein